MKEAVAVIFGLGLIINALLFLPQIRSILKTRSAEGVSLMTFSGFTLMQAIGVLHGVMQKDWSLIFGMGASLLTCGTATLLAFAYRPKRKG